MPTYFAPLVTNIHFLPGNIILNFNVLTIVTELPEHDGHAVDCLEAVGQCQVQEMAPLARCGPDS